MFASRETIRDIKEIPVITNLIKKRAERIVDNVGIENYLKKDGNYLDIGIGDGYIVQIILKRMSEENRALKNYFSVDIKYEVLNAVQEAEFDRLKKTKKGVSAKNSMNFILANAEGLPFASNTLDGTSFFFSLHHMDKKVADKALKEAVRVVKSGGKIFVAEDLVGNGKHEELCEKMDRCLNFENDDAEHSYRSDREWQKCFEKMGLKLIDKKNFKTKMRSITIDHIFYVLKKM